MIDRMGASTDSGWFGPADDSQGRPGRTDTRECGLHPENEGYAKEPGKLDGNDELDPLDPEEPEVSDPSGDLPVEVYPEEQSPLSEGERQSVTDSAQGFVKFAARKLVSLAADHVVPVFGGRFVDWGFEIKDAVASVRALDGDDRVLEVPLPSPVPGLGLSLEVPLPSGEDGQAAPPVALCAAPDSASLTGGWALDSAGHNDQQELEQTQEQDPASWATLAAETRDADQPEPRVRHRSAAACLVEIDLGALQLPGHRKFRAGVLAALMAEYAPLLRENADLGRFDLFIIADTGRRCGQWIWLDTDIEVSRLASRPQLDQIYRV